MLCKVTSCYVELCRGSRVLSGCVMVSCARLCHGSLVTLGLVKLSLVRLSYGMLRQSR